MDEGFTMGFLDDLFGGKERESEQGAGKAVPDLPVPFGYKTSFVLKAILPRTLWGRWG